MHWIASPARISSLALIVGFATVQSAAANPLTVAPLTKISGPSLFASCAVGASVPPVPGETLYVNAEEEPWLDVNPANASSMIAVWQQDRWSDGGAHGLVAGVTHDSGTTWTRTFAHFSACAGGNATNGGNYERSSDPWVSIGPTGTAYQISLSFDANSARNGVLVSKSADGGDTWSEPTSLIRDSGSRDVSYAFNDKEAITADPPYANYAYAVLGRCTTPSGTSLSSSAGLIHFSSFRGPRRC